jgi:hypothetical protein
MSKMLLRLTAPPFVAAVVALAETDDDRLFATSFLAASVNNDDERLLLLLLPSMASSWCSKRSYGLGVWGCVASPTERRRQTTWDDAQDSGDVGASPSKTGEEFVELSGDRATTPA